MKNGSIALFLLILVPATLVRMKDMDRPFDNGHRGSCGAFYTLQAENHLRYGFRTTGLVPVLNPRPVDREHLVYYEHHPPGIMLLTAMVFSATGSTSETVARALPLFLSLLALVVLFVLVRRASGTPVAFCTMALAASVPLAAYYGAFLNFETFVLPPVLLSIHLYMKWIETGRSASLRGSLAFLALGILMDWIAVVAGVLLMLDGLLFGRGRSPSSRDPDGTAGGSPAPLRKGLLLLYPAVGVLVFGAIRVWFAVQNARFGSPSETGMGMIRYILDTTLLYREFEFVRFAENIAGYLAGLLTWPVAAVALSGMILFLSALVKERPLRMETRSLLILLIWGGLNLLIFAAHAMKHDYWILLLYPGLCWCAALLILRFCRLMGGGGNYAARSTAAAGFLTAVLAGVGLYRSLAIISERRGDEELHQRGRAYAELAEGEELILTPATEPIQVVFYSKGAVYPYGIPSPDRLALVLPHMEKYGYRDLPMVFAVRRGEAGKWKETLQAFEQIGSAGQRGLFIVIRL